MAGMTRLQIVTEICDIVGKGMGASAVSGGLLQNRVVTYLNWGQRRIANHYSFYELQQTSETPTTVADVKTYPLESGTNNLGLSRVATVNSVRLIDSENSRKLDFWHYRRFDKTYPRPENFVSARPSIYTRWGNNLILFKIPNAAYSLHIRYGQYANNLDSDGQRHDFGEDKDQLILTAGVLETYLALEEYTDAKIWYELFLGRLTDAVKAEGDDDWEPEAQEFRSGSGYTSGEPWIDPYIGGPLQGYSE
jgi:hypothetical protein